VFFEISCSKSWEKTAKSGDFCGDFLGCVQCVEEKSRKSPEELSTMIPANIRCFKNETSQQHAKFLNNTLPKFCKNYFCVLQLSVINL